MEPPTVEELKLREARVQGAEQAISALKDATATLELRAREVDAEIRRVEDRQVSNLKWTIAAILGFGAILASIGIMLLLDQADARRALDDRITTEVAAIRQQTDAIDRSVNALAQSLQSVDQDAEQGRRVAEGLSSAVAAMQQQLADAVHRTDLLMGRLSANIDNIRADFAYLVEGGGYRSSFEGRIYVDVPYESTDADPTGTFISDIEVSVLSSGGQLRAGTLRVTVPGHGRIPRQWVIYSLSMQFLAALADLVDSANAAELTSIGNVDTLLSRFYEHDVWPVLMQATVERRLTDFVIEGQPIESQ